MGIFQIQNFKGAPDGGVWFRIPQERQIIFHILQLLFGPMPHPEWHLQTLDFVSREILQPIPNPARKKGPIPSPEKSHRGPLNVYMISEE